MLNLLLFQNVLDGGGETPSRSLWGPHTLVGSGHPTASEYCPAERATGRQIRLSTIGGSRNSSTISRTTSPRRPATCSSSPASSQVPRQLKHLSMIAPRNRTLSRRQPHFGQRM